MQLDDLRVVRVETQATRRIALARVKELISVDPLMDKLALRGLLRDGLLILAVMGTEVRIGSTVSLAGRPFNRSAGGETVIQTDSDTNAMLEQLRARSRYSQSRDRRKRAQQSELESAARKLRISYQNLHAAIWHGLPRGFKSSAQSSRRLSAT